MGRSKSPLSPHLQVYKPQLTSVLSITHRGTGVVLALALLLVPYWLLSIAAGPEAYASMLGHFSAWYGKVFLFVTLFSLYYHLCNGIRHLGWDLGLGFDIGTTYLTGYVVIFLSVLATFATCLWVRLS